MGVLNVLYLGKILGYILEKRRVVNVCAFILPLIQGGLGYLKLVPSFIGASKVLVIINKHLLSN